MIKYLIVIICFILYIMRNFIYIHNSSLSTELCKDIIKQFDIDKHLSHEGVTSSGVVKSIKDSLDLNILHHENEWNKFKPVLFRELKKHVYIYLTQYNRRLLDYEIDTLQIQRYEKNIGIFKTHTDELNTYEKSREIVFMWYLNDVENGGETCFPEQDIDVKPEAGKLVLFPSTWTYPHRANIPLSSNKYIITGWFYKIHNE